MSDFRGWVLKPNGLNTIVAKWVYRHEDLYHSMFFLSVNVWPGAVCIWFTATVGHAAPRCPGCWGTWPHATPARPWWTSSGRPMVTRLSGDIRACRPGWWLDIGFYFEVDAAARMCKPWRLHTRPAPRGYNTRWVRNFPECRVIEAVNESLTLLSRKVKRFLCLSTMNDETLKSLRNVSISV